jgi:hypothetical protein
MIAFLTQQQPPPNAPEFGAATPVGLVVILVLFVATGLLVKSMNTHLKKVPESFGEPDAADQDADGGATRDPAGGTTPDPAAGRASDSDSDSGPKTATPQ